MLDILAKLKKRSYPVGANSDKTLSKSFGLFEAAKLEDKAVIASSLNCQTTCAFVEIGKSKSKLLQKSTKKFNGEGFGQIIRMN